MRRKPIVVPSLAVLLLTAACGKEELERRLADASQKERETAARLADASAEVAKLRADLNDARKAGHAQAERITALETAARDEERRAKKDSERHDAVVRDRDDLRRWIRDELLPLAEKASPDLGNLARATDTLGAQVAEKRRLAWKEPILRRRITRADMAAYMRREFEREFSGDKGKDLVAVGEELGLLPRGSDVPKLLEQFLEAGVAGFYSPDARTFCLVEGNDGRGAYPVVFHELVHALEDQHYDLDATYRSVQDDDDRALAVRGLIEGSASFFQDLYDAENPGDVAAMMKAQMTPESMQRQAKMLQSVPAFIFGVLALYPYNNGKWWVREVTGGDPAKVDALFADLPDSTEQILHPAKFTAPAGRDRPHRIDAPDLSAALPAGWRRTQPGVLGELQLGCLLAQLRFPGPSAVLAILDMRTQGLSFKDPIKSAVEGWDGDRLSAAVDPATGRATVCWVSAWDTAEDAAQFVEAYGPLLGKRTTGEKPDDLPSPVRFTDAEGRVSGIAREGRRVVVVLGASAGAYDDVLRAGTDAKISPDPRDAADVADAVK